MRRSRSKLDWQVELDDVTSPGCFVSARRPGPTPDFSRGSVKSSPVVSPRQGRRHRTLLSPPNIDINHHIKPSIDRVFPSRTGHGIINMRTVIATGASSGLVSLPTGSMLYLNGPSNEGN